MIEFQMPSLGADMEAGTLIEWRKKLGDSVKRGDIIAEVETQKGLIEIEVFDEGIIGELLIKEGAKVPVGTVMALINPTETTMETRKEKIPEKPVVKIQPTEEIAIEKVAAEKFEERHLKVSPLAKRMAAENNIDLSKIQGTGEDGAITKDDVDKAISQKGKIGKPEEAIPKNEPIRSAIAAAMSKSNKEIPHYYLEKRIDITKALAWLREANGKRPIQKRLLPAALLIKAVAKSLVDFPELNAIWDNGLQIKNEINIGFVVSLRGGGGVIIPSIHNANEKNIDEIMKTLNDTIPRARAMKLRSSDLIDSTITITSLGEGGADVVFGVIYPPQVAIIGFGGSSQQPFIENGMLGIRTVFTVTLAGDHRATDGITGSDFLVTLNKQLQNPEAL